VTRSCPSEHTTSLSQNPITENILPHFRQSRLPCLQQACSRSTLQQKQMGVIRDALPHLSTPITSILPVLGRTLHGIAICMKIRFVRTSAWSRLLDDVPVELLHQPPSEFIPESLVCLTLHCRVCLSFSARLSFNVFFEP